MTETVENQVENVEKTETVEKVEEPVANGDQKTENTNGDVTEAAPGNEEAPNATSTPVKEKKRRQIMANMRTAFARMGLMDQLRSLGRRMRKSPKSKKSEEETTNEEEKKDEEKPVENGADERMNGEAEESKKEEECSEEKPEAIDEQANEPASSPAVPPVETCEPTAVAAQ